MPVNQTTQTIAGEDVPVSEMSGLSDSDIFNALQTGNAIYNDGPALETMGYDIIVDIGQSEIIGRYGPIDPVLDVSDPQIYQYGPADTTIKVAAHPLPHSGVTADTIGPGLESAKAYAATISSKRKVLIFCGGIGGTGFSSGEWAAGGARREYVITEVNALLASNPNSRVVGFIWQQGQKDDGQTQSYYANELARLIHDYRTNIQTAKNAPFIVTEVGDWSSKYNVVIRNATRNMQLHVDNVQVVSAEGTVDGGDGLHMDAASSRLIGQRQGAALNALIKSPRIVKEADAAGHWLLNVDNAGYFDSSTGKELTETNLAPTVNNTYLTLGDADFNGLESDIVDSQEQTICVVYRAIDAADSFIVGGTLENTGSGGGSAIFANGTGDLRYIIRQYPAFTATDFVVAGEWRFAALAESNMQNFFLGHLNAPLKNRGLLGNKDVSTQGIAVGNSYYNVTAFKSAIDVAEFIVFDRALSADQIADVYERTVTRLGNIGLIVE